MSGRKEHSGRERSEDPTITFESYYVIDRLLFFYQLSRWTINVRLSSSVLMFLKLLINKNFFGRYGTLTHSTMWWSGVVHNRIVDKIRKSISEIYKRSTISKTYVYSPQYMTHITIDGLKCENTKSHLSYF